MSRQDAVSRNQAYLRASNELRGNEGQWAAYESQGHCVVLAGPGSGKTKTLTIKMARMLSEDVARPHGLACITYNTQCAQELRDRLNNLGIQPSQNIFIGTVHSFCLHHIVKPFAHLAGLDLPDPIKVAPPSIQRRIFKRAIDVEVASTEDASVWRTRADRYRRTHIDRDDPLWLENEELARVIESYEVGLRAEGYIDFDDMVLVGLYLIEKCAWVRKLIHSKFPILVADEYQDLGLPLHRIVLSLCLNAGIRLFAVGDPDQSIYGFTGANPELLRELSDVDIVETVQLNMNYRCGRTIVNASKAAIAEEREFWTPENAHQGTIAFYKYHGGIQEQAEKICSVIIPTILERRPGSTLGDIAILYLDKNDGNVIADAAEDAGFKYVRHDQNAPYQRTPFTRWLEECAGWCSDGWQRGSPRLSHLSQTWANFHHVKSETVIRDLKLLLVRFLWANRNGDQPLRDWLQEFANVCLNGYLLRPDASDEREAFDDLLRATKEGGTIANYSVGTFSGQAGAEDHLHLITLHSAKGLEFDVVILMGMEQGRIPSYRATSKDAKREPRRLFYVGLTRARHEVHITCSGWYKVGQHTFKYGCSEFVTEVKRALTVDIST